MAQIRCIAGKLHVPRPHESHGCEAGQTGETGGRPGPLEGDASHSGGRENKRKPGTNRKRAQLKHLWLQLESNRQPAAVWEQGGAVGPPPGELLHFYSPAGRPVPTRLSPVDSQPPRQSQRCCHGDGRANKPTEDRPGTNAAEEPQSKQEVPNSTPALAGASRGLVSSRGFDANSDVSVL